MVIDDTKREITESEIVLSKRKVES